MLGYFLNLTIMATVILFGSGGFLVYDSVSHAGMSQIPEVIGGFTACVGLNPGVPAGKVRDQDARLAG